MYKLIKCPTCNTNLEVSQVPDYCPVAGCGAYLKDKLHMNFTGSGLDETQVPDSD